MKKDQPFIYQKTKRFFAQISRGMEEIGAQELAELGAERIKPDFRGIYFNSTLACLYRINYMARTVTRILAPLRTFPCSSTDSLYKNAGLIEWPELFKTDNTFAVFANVSRSSITHSQYAGLCLKDAIADQFRERYNKRPSVDPRFPDVWINLHIDEDKASISLDTSGGSLHRRGYRKASLEAPMQESLAAAIIKLTKWDGEKTLYDPMCGAGTLLSEALMHYCRIPSGYLRPRFGFEFLPDFEKMIWLSVKKKADKKIRPLPEGLISGSDISPHALEASEMNNQSLPYGNAVKLKKLSFEEIPALENTVIVCNPPYGIRIGKTEDSQRQAKELGDFLKQRCKGSEAYIYFGDRELIKYIGLKPAWKKPLMNGGLDGRLVKYELY